MKYQEARDIAIRIGKQLQPFCSKLNIAGSIRRGKPDVKDIELMAVPFRAKASLFDTGEFDESQPVVPEFRKLVMELGWPQKGTPDGRYMQIKLQEGICLDLFMPAPYDYYRQYAIRTGSADYSHKVLAAAWVAKGWVGVKDIGLRKRNQCSERIDAGDKKHYTPFHYAEKPPVWESEEAFFEWLGIPWIEPNKRQHENDYTSLLPASS